MLILVDYDNINRTSTRRGVTYVVREILSKIDPTDLNGINRVDIRLYGGWYEQNNFTIKAQNISTEISANFPASMKISDNITSVIVNCEMAYSLLSDPNNHLFHTYRRRGVPTNLRSRHPNQVGCTNATCPIIPLHSFIKNDICNSCSVIKPENILFKGEQKLVDTMLTSDLIFSSGIQSELCIVSSDDDFWPGIITTISSGKRVLHLHTRNRPTPVFYSRNAGSNYVQKFL